MSGSRLGGLFYYEYLLIFLGKAFDGIWTRSVTNQCNKQSSSDTQLTWTYNDDRQLPPCVGKI